MSKTIITKTEVGPLSTCCYAMHCEGAAETVMVDPGADADRIIEMLRARGLQLERILLTHSHYDHIGAVDQLMAAYPDALLSCHDACGERIGDPVRNLSAPVMGVGGRVKSPWQALAPDNEFRTAGLLVRPIHVPGHAPGHLVFHVPEAGAAFCGDVIFAGGIGRADLPESDYEQLISGILALAALLPAETSLYPGHGPATTVSRELLYNPFLRR